MDQHEEIQSEVRENPETRYGRQIGAVEEFHRRQIEGKVVVKPSDRGYEINTQSEAVYYLDPYNFDDTCLTDWWVFTNEVRTQSGKHRHQGGLALFVVAGKGYTIADEVRYDWEAGDLILLPLKPGGTEHQHFNAQPGESCRFLALINLPIWWWGASELVQTEARPHA